jgi:hypothetical protein
MAEERKNTKKKLISKGDFKKRKEKEDELTVVEEKDIDKRVVNYWLAKGKKRKKKKGE